MLQSLKTLDIMYCDETHRILHLLNRPLRVDIRLPFTFHL